MTETINSIDYATGWQYSVTGTNVSNNGASLLPPTTTNTVIVNPMGGTEGSSHKFSDWFRFKQRQLYNHGTRESVPIHVNISRVGNYKPDCNPKSYRRYFNNRYNKCLYAVAALFLTTPAYANVGGVSATANPIANSSGSVTNQVHSGAPGVPYITNTYGNGIQCQGFPQ